MPRTPERKLSEISAFSPWDSPSDRRASIQVNRDRQSPLRKIATFGNLRHSVQEYTPTRKPLVAPRKSSAPGPSINVSPTYTSPLSSISTSALESSKTKSQPQPTYGPPPPAQHEHEHKGWRKCEDLARILDELEQFINDYPSGLLQLDSLVILQIRDSHSLDELHLNRLGKIFPNTNQLHLSALAAILIAQSYLAKLRPICRPPSEPRQRLPISKYCQLAASSDESLMKKRAKILEGGLHAVVEKMMVVVCGKFDDLVWRTLMCLVETVEVWW
jgi:hypothetical protein